MKTQIIDMENIMISGTYSIVNNMEICNCTMEGKVFSGSSIKQSSFKRVIFKDCVFFGAEFEACNFIGCEFVNCQIQFSGMKKCNFVSTLFINCTWLQGSGNYNLFSNCQFDHATLAFFGKMENEFQSCFSDHQKTKERAS